MRLAALCFGLLLLLTLSGDFQSRASAQDPQDDDVRGAFLTSRPNTADKPTKTTAPSSTRRRRPTPAPTKPPVDHATPSGPKGEVVPRKDPGASRARLGLGLTLFMRDSNGLAVRVDPSHEFHKGDLVRVLLETNADGFLYIFNTTDGGAPTMIYPQPELDDAGNFIHSHVPFEIPSSTATAERLRWFSFDENAGSERLYFVFTREPLPNVPIEDEMIKFCADNNASCPWHPGKELWTSLQKEMDEPLASNNSRKFGRSETTAERDATTRGIGLAKNDPEPVLVLMSTSSSPRMLVTGLELFHK